MQFVKCNEVYKIAKITGPKHNLLGLKLSRTKTDINVVSLISSKNHENDLDKNDILTQVCSGLDNINKDLGSSFYISEIQYVPSDTYSATIYEELTAALIRRIHAKEDFIEVSS